MLTKSHLIAEISKFFPHLPEKDVSDAVNLILEKIVQSLIAGKRIEIRDFGNLDLHYRAPRQAHNPKTGKKLTTSAKYVVHFKCGKELKELVNQNKHLPIRKK